MANLAVEELRVGRVYRGKEPRLVGTPARPNDRELTWISKPNPKRPRTSQTCSYKHLAGRREGRVVCCTIGEFLVWAGSVVG